MKNLHISLVLGCFVVLLSSCNSSTSTVFSVSGEPGTEIMTPSHTKLATIDNSGTAKITNPDDQYYAFLLSHKPGTKDYIPFALDYEEKSYPGSAIAKYTGYGIAMYSGFIAMVGLGVAALTPDKTLGLTMAGISLVPMFGGLMIGTPGDERCSQTNHEYHYKYLPTQKTNQDLSLTKPVFSTETVQPIVEKVEEGQKSNRTLSQKSTRTLKDYGKLTEGTYNGQGTLKQGTNTIESYDKISVVITRANKDEVDVNVIESGSEFFPSAIRYTITKKKDGSYVLKAKTLSSATINIDKNGSLTFNHPKVNIEGDIYVLSVNANKKK